MNPEPHSSEVSNSAVRNESEPTEDPSKGIEWLISAVLAIVGGLGALLGVFLSRIADRELSADIVAEMETRSNWYSPAETADILYNLMVWGSYGLIVTGGLIVVAGVGFQLYRNRLRREPAGPQPDTKTNIFLGGLATIVASFLPFSPVFGGMVTGYLEHREGGSSLGGGGLSGLVATLPAVVMGGFLAVGLVLADAAVIAIVLVCGLVATVTISVALGAVGGYIGDRLIAGDDGF